MNEIFVNKWKSQVKKGTLTFVVLNVLQDKEFYGYEFIEEIKKLTDIDLSCWANSIQILLVDRTSPRS